MLSSKWRRVSSRDYWAYWIAIPLTVGGFILGRGTLVEQEPWGTVITSNITVLLLLTFGVWGWLSSWIFEKKFPRAPKWASWAVAAGAGIGLIAYFSFTGGFSLRW